MNKSIVNEAIVRKKVIIDFEQISAITHKQLLNGFINNNN